MLPSPRESDILEKEVMISCQDPSSLVEQGLLSETSSSKVSSTKMVTVKLTEMQPSSFVNQTRQSFKASISKVK